jgi:hypothetical protein
LSLSTFVATGKIKQIETSKLPLATINRIINVFFTP